MIDNILTFIKDNLDAFYTIAAEREIASWERDVAFLHFSYRLKGTPKLAVTDRGSLYIEFIYTATCTSATTGELYPEIENFGEMPIYADSFDELLYKVASYVPAYREWGEVDDDISAPGSVYSKFCEKAGIENEYKRRKTHRKYPNPDECDFRDALN